MNDNNKANAEKVNSNSNDDDTVLNNEVSNMKINSRSNNRNCLCCLKEVEGSSRCSKCRAALYCNRDCQLKHWPVHKNICEDSNNAEDSDEKLLIKAINHSKQGNFMPILSWTIITNIIICRQLSKG